MKYFGLMISFFCLYCGDSGTVVKSQDAGIAPPKILEEQLDVVDCENNTTDKFKVEDLIGEKATLLTFHTGWCGVCQYQIANMEQQYQQYKNDGFKTILVFFEDREHNTNYNSLLEYACIEKEGYGLSFSVIIDPGAVFFNKYTRANGVPFNIILNSEGRIVLKMPGYSIDVITRTIENLLGID